MTDQLAVMARSACDEIAGVFHHMDASGTDDLIAEIRRARRIAVYGVGREGLMMKAFAMRLYHLGLDAHVVGDMTTPPISQGDILIVSAGPGDFSTVAALMAVAGKAGARTVCVTAQPAGSCPARADTVVHLPAQTMADDRTADAAGNNPTPRTPSILPMGSLYEGVQYVFFEVVVLMLRDALGIKPEAMRSNHTNLE
jgi:6-phospho-3-hexuloisomerase